MVDFARGVQLAEHARIDDPIHPAAPEIHECLEELGQQAHDQRPESLFGHVLWGFAPRTVRMRPCPVELHLLGVATCWGLNWGSLIKVHDTCAGSFQRGGERRHAGATKGLCEGGTIVLASYIMIIGAMLEKQWRVECVPGGVPTLLRRLAAVARWPQMLLLAMI